MDIKTIELKKTILEDNDKDANLLREQLRQAKTFYVNVMSSPGSGKTTTLVSTIRHLQQDDAASGDLRDGAVGGGLQDAAVGGGPKQGDGLQDAAAGTKDNPSARPLKIGVMEADIDSDVDAHTIAEQTGAPSVQLHTGGMCHLDAEMSRQGLREIGYEDLDLVFLENVGNLVCPAEFDTGAHAKAVILSVPEGDDKPLKYPLMFEEADVVLVTKIDAMEAFDFAPEKFRENLAGVNPDAPVFFLSGATGEGVAEWAVWLREKVEKYLT